jgi:hypothetical protein
MIIDLPLIVVCAGVFAALSVLHLALRPELRNGRKLSRVYSYAIGLGCYAAGVLTLALWRGITGPQAIIDVGGLLVAAAIPPIMFRFLYGEPRGVYPQRDEDVRAAIESIKRNAQEVTK